jgi:hypothetical protein
MVEIGLLETNRRVDHSPGTSRSVSLLIEKLDWVGCDLPYLDVDHSHPFWVRCLATNAVGCHATEAVLVERSMTW